ncbi:MAG: hypothetical protein U0163_03680 [Gemmatimonadaceae bacterium]
MDDRTPDRPGQWPMWQRIAFRFFFVYLLLQIAPWNWLGTVPLVSTLGDAWFAGVDVAVRWANAHLFHVRDTLVLPNGSGDTSWAWTQLWLYLSLAAVSCIAWSIADRRRTEYQTASYWLRTIVRFYIANFALGYGIIKLFALQMSFPSLSQLATPLGDFLPMRLSWMFIGYSTRYQVFSGVMETVAGLLLLYRPTVTLGLFAATGAFINVVMINLSYDVPVKLFASHLLLACVFLLLWDARRLTTFLVLNRAASGTNAYDPPFTRRWQHQLRWVAKAAFVLLFLILPLRDSYRRWYAQAHEPPSRPFAAGVYDVRRFVVNGDTVPPLVSDSLRWRDVIIDNAGGGSVGSRDSVFWQRYRRGYFRYKADTVRHTVAVWKTNTAFDSTYLFDMRYELPDTNAIRFWAKIRRDSVYVDLVRSNRHFQLAERQFHWLSEYNR